MLRFLKLQGSKLMAKGLVIWLTGLSGAGKSSLGLSLKEKLVDLGRSAILVDADIIRKGVCKDLGFSFKDKNENIRRISEITKICSDQNLITIVASISPHKKGRDNARRLIEKDAKFYEIYVKASLKEVKRRDYKGLYKKFDEGKIKNLSGIDSKYEIPDKPDIIIDSEKNSIKQSVHIVYQHIFQNI